MSQNVDLEKLKQHRNALLLAEVAAWLHDDFKCTEQQIFTYTNKAPKPSGRQDTGDLLPPRQITLLGKTLNFSIVKKRDAEDFCDGYLNRCHFAAHIEKEEAKSIQDYPPFFSSPFGYERPIIQNLTQTLRNSLLWNDLKQSPLTPHDREEIKSKISKIFTPVGAETRRPTNEVSLWDWGSLVGALYKAALAGALLGDQPQAHDLRWRLLSVRFDGLNYLLNAARIPDLLARQELLADGLNKVRELLEVTYPLGSEVYRDENGSIYVMPNLPDLLEAADGQGASLRALILRAFAQGTVKDKPNLQLGGEIVPHIELEQTPWWGQDPDWATKTQLNNELPSIAKFLAQKIVSSADSKAVRQYWNGEAADICPVCGLRPQGPSEKAKDRKVCNICEERRADRSKVWATSQTDQTIWNDEVADTNGRMALITGQFDLSHWLDGSLLETLLVVAPNDPQNTPGAPVTPKTPSFSRLRRIWETTRTFWNEVQTEILEKLKDDRRRLKIYLDKQPDLGPFHAYDLIVGSSELSVVWVPPQNGQEGYLVSIDNLCYLARQLGATTDVYKHPAASAIFVEDYLKAQFVEQSRQPILYNADVHAEQKKKNLLAGISIRETAYQSNQYATAIPILAEPRSFIILVPADKSLEILRCVKNKYEREMGKVRNRLPLHVGAVFFGRRTPFFAALDAARALLDAPLRSEQWSVDSVNETGHLKFENGIAWHVPAVMGDGATEDRWYPYFELASAPNVPRARQFQHNGKPWVHLKDLQPGDTVSVTPSRFDFIWLDTAARRFALAYDETGRRSDRPSRPYYLEDLDRLEQVWQAFFKLSRTQLKQTLQTIETARERWFGRDEGRKSADNDTFRQFVADTLAVAQWPKSKSDPKQTIFQENREQLITAAVRGELTDLAELHLEILKEKNEKE